MALRGIIGLLVAAVGVTLLLAFQTVLFPVLLIISGTLWFFSRRNKKDQGVKWGKFGTIVFGLGTLLVFGSTLFSSAEADDSNDDYFAKKEAKIEQRAREREASYFLEDPITGVDNLLTNNYSEQEITHNPELFAKEAAAFLQENIEDYSEGIIFRQLVPVENEEGKTDVTNSMAVEYRRDELKNLNVEALSESPMAFYENASTVYINDDFIHMDAYEPYIDLANQPGSGSLEMASVKGNVR